MGDTFLLAQADIHLWVVLSDPDKDPDRIVLVSLTTLTPDKEPACLLVRGEHPWVKHDTCVFYQGARLAALKELYKLKDAGLLKPQEPLSEHVLLRIQKNGGDSTWDDVYADILIEQGLLDC